MGYIFYVEKACESYDSIIQEDRVFILLENIMKGNKKSWMALFILIVFGLTSTACAQKKHGGGHEDNPRGAHIKSNLKNVSHFVAVTGDGKYIVFDKQGRPIDSCQICTKELENELKDPFCKNAIKEGKTIKGKKICKALSGATVQSVDTVTTIKTHNNPYCQTLIIGGVAFPIGPGCV